MVASLAQKKIVVIGDSSCGKTTLIELFLKDVSFFCLAMDNCVEFYAVVPHPEGQDKVNVTITEVRPDVPAGQRRKAYESADAIILCYSVDDFGALPQIRYMWDPEIRMYVPRTPVFLVGLKSDKRDPDVIHEFGLIPALVGDNLKLRYEFVSYTECSAISGATATPLFNQILSYSPSLV